VDAGFWLKISALGIAGLVAVSVRAQELSSDDGPNTIITGLAGNPETCNLGTAAKIDLEELFEHPRPLKGKCVAVRGYWFGRALFATREEARLKYSPSTAKLEGRRLGLYGRDDVISPLPERPMPRVAVGTLVLCEDLWEGSLMVMGYCHSNGGPALAVAELKKR
jgi:hypothetical protein